jgi:YHS domain-containing protein
VKRDQKPFSENDKGGTMKRYSLLFYILCGMIFSSVSAKASEVYCSLNDGQKADGKSKLEHQGAKYEFCCSGCLQQFKDNPKMFAQQIQQPQGMNSIDSKAAAEAACSSVCGGN